ncbi:MAG: NTPase [Candidatus Bathyarchaeia archaeon]
MYKRVLLLTGSPVVGKTTLLLRIVDALRAKGYGVGGMISREVRSCGARVGFEILDLSSDERGWLAHVNQKTGPQVGKYRVNLEDLDMIGVKAITKAVKDCNVIVIDEIGPMELFSEKFKQAVKEAAESGRLIVGVIHWKAHSRLIDMLKAREDAEIFTVTLENRDELHKTVTQKAEKFLKGQRLKL